MALVVELGKEKVVVILRMMMMMHSSTSNANKWGQGCGGLRGEGE